MKRELIYDYHENETRKKSESLTLEEKLMRQRPPSVSFSTDDHDTQ